MHETNFFKKMNPKDTLGYEYVNGEDLKDTKLNCVSIIGCEIQNSNFSGVDFNSSDFDGTILMESFFKKCNLSYTDFCSVSAVGISFEDINFSLSIMRNCEFRNCKFINCNFNHIALTNSRFINCDFFQIHIKESSTYLNTYTYCTFDSCDINGNFFYNILAQNTYKKSTFSPKLIGYNYFNISTKKELENINFTSRDISKYDEYLNTNKLLVNMIILKLNISLDCDMCLVSFALAIGKLLENKIAIRNEQIEFFEKLIEYFDDNNILSPISVVQSWGYLENVLTFYSFNNSFDNCKATLNSLKNTLFSLYQKMAQQISFDLIPKHEDKENLVKIVFDKEPEIPICTIVNEIKDTLGLSDRPNAYRIKSEKGSFIEWISCYDSIVNCLVLFITIIGVVNTIHTNKIQKSTTEHEEKDSIENKDISETELMELVNKTLAKQKINPEVNQTINIILRNEITANKNFRGYKKSNIRKIEIIYQNK